MIMSWSIKVGLNAKLTSMELPLAVRLTILICVLTIGLTSANGDCPDQYVYTKQPPQELWVCNPYLNGQLQLTCSVIGENVTDIQWWFAPSFADEGENKLLTNGTKYDLMRMEVESGLETQLTVNDLGDTDVGLYWCQASVTDAHGIQLLSTSEDVELTDKGAFMVDAPPCNFVPKNSERRCASIIITESASISPTTFPEPSPSSPSLPLTPSSLPPSHPPSSPPASKSPPPQSFLGGSSIILYAVLGLVGFLAIVCFILCTIVFILCRRRCSRAHQKSDSVEKEMAFEPFSDQSGPSLGYKHTSPMQFIDSDTHSRTLSGEYAEIGPALSQSLGYAEIGRLSHDNLPPLPSEMPPESSSQVPTPGYENPYDLPIFPFGQEPRRETDVASTKSQEMGQMENTDSQSLGSHGYHVLEQITPLNAATSPQLADQHHTYHILEEPSSSSSWQPAMSCDQGHSAGVDFTPDDDAYDDIVQRDPSPRLSCSSNMEPVRLPTIPEHEAEDDCSVDLTSVVQVTHLVGNDCVSPDVTTRPHGNCTGFSECSNDEEGYDRLIDPPHLYHILEHSPSTGSPRIHSFPPPTYSNQELRGHGVEKKSSILPHTHILSTQGGLVNLTYTSSSSLDATRSSTFDDHHYQGSPPAERENVSKSSRGVDRRELQTSVSCTHAQDCHFVNHTTEFSAPGDVSVLKYSGDYERDPLYMQRLYHDVSRNGGRVSDKMSTLATEDSSWNDDSGFSTFSGSRSSLQDHERRSSLPNMNKHVYQSLETETLEPPQPYDKLNNKETSA